MAFQIIYNPFTHNLQYVTVGGGSGIPYTGASSPIDLNNQTVANIQKLLVGATSDDGSGAILQVNGGISAVGVIRTDEAIVDVSNLNSINPNNRTLIGLQSGEDITLDWQNFILVGNWTTTTQSPGDNSTKLATTAYVDNAVADTNVSQWVGTVPGDIYYDQGNVGIGTDAPSHQFETTDTIHHQPAFFTDADGRVSSANNVLDDGSANAEFNGAVTFNNAIVDSVQSSGEAGQVLKATGLSTVLWTNDPVSTKADKPTMASAQDNILAELDSTGNLVNSGLTVTTDITLGDNSDSEIPTEHAVKTYINGLIANTTLNGENIVYTFLGNPDGSNPKASLLLIGNTFYGTCYFGGTHGTGTIFSIDTDGNNYTTLYNFAGGTDGANPQTALTLFGSTLYGTCLQGGTNNTGTIFSINTNGSGYATLYNFAGGTDGANPFSTLVLIGSTLYGSCFSGGTNNTGTIFSIDGDGNNYTTLYNFAGGTDGANPAVSLLLVGSTFYGTCQNGGTNNTGTIFKIDTDGNNYATLYNFAGGTDGANPATSFTLIGSTLYGSSIFGGTNNNGTIFSIDTDGNNYTVLHNFDSNTEGANPQDSLLLIGNTFYGICQQGGTQGKGTIFSINTNGNNFTVLYNFTGGADGENPVATLILVGSVLYSVCANGGTVDNTGVIFSLNLDITKIIASVTYVETRLTTKSNVASSPTAGDIASVDSDGNVTDSGKVFDTDSTLNTNSDSNIATQKAVKTYVDSHFPKVVASIFEKPETGTDANVLTYTAGGTDEFLNVQVAVDISALTGTSIVVTVAWQDSNNASQTSIITLTGVGDGTINIPINALTATNVVVSTVFVGVSTVYKISAIITRLN